MFAYTLILPLALKFFVLASPDNVLPMTDINSYLDFCLKLFLAFGLVFQIPVLTYILIFIGLISIQQLEAHRKHIVYSSFLLQCLLPLLMFLACLLLQSQCGCYLNWVYGLKFTTQKNIH